MSKKIKAQVKLQLPGGGATPAPPVGSTLGQHGVNLMDFCKKFNAASANRKGETVPVQIVIYQDKTFDFVLKTPPVSELLRKKANISKGAKNPGKERVSTLKWKDVEDIAKIKLPDLSAFDLEAAKKVIAGSARSMGIAIVE
ncbi:50S ribosomal protein L11 [Candidatus Dependentiae bacterium]|nr:50S ribosomal protein L11 [Candidatus Dependentiae bacterium]